MVLSLAMKACRTFFAPCLHVMQEAIGGSVRLESCQHSSIISGVPFMTTYGIFQFQALNEAVMRHLPCCFLGNLVLTVITTVIISTIIYSSFHRHQINGLMTWAFFFFFKIYVCSILPAYYIYEPHVTWYLKRSEEGIGSPGTGVTDTHEPLFKCLGAGNRTQVLCENY